MAQAHLSVASNIQEDDSAVAQNKLLSFINRDLKTLGQSSVLVGLLVFRLALTVGSWLHANRSP